ncbi:DNA-deoxyinosine glycosylase [Duganella sp. CY15W]|uniref:DNA-deoxyinosine glycosylase n=1 Tax=Duganella sp. CY15W TaxID=2692172 RepID=UPI001368FC73|nr:DNA-deoxyinosine glycosylase [Duganella sp. CY15W]MYM29981.1 DNA-deoxyinosine glycosylase [Duganella sp. CY15W]
MSDELRKRCFDPVVNPHTRLLVLGSLPGEKSLAEGRYYAHKQNAFWYLMSQVIGVDLVPLEYPARLATLLAHGVGLWDVIAEARRDGSLDSNIKQHRGNDLPGLIQSLPALTTIGFNGRTAAKVGRKQIATLADQLNLIELPSSSPAYTMALAQKREAWLALRASR